MNGVIGIKPLKTPEAKGVYKN